jgi:hypothetical protein
MSFEIAGGSVAGRAHALAGKPNQDAYAWIERDGVLVAAVCDGCGSGAHSEVGAQLGARIVTARLAQRLLDGGALDSASLWSDLRADVLGALRGVATAMGGRLSEVVSEHFLFTVVGLALEGERGCLFAAGDGIAAVDEAVIQLGPFPRNEPPYLGYGLLNPEAPGFSVIRSFASAEVQSLLIGTDGAADLEGLAHTPLRTFWEDDRHFHNRDAVRRRLALLNREAQKPLWAERRIEREPGLLGDDTTVVVVRRRSAHGRLSA